MLDTARLSEARSEKHLPRALESQEAAYRSKILAAFHGTAEFMKAMESFVHGDLYKPIGSEKVVANLHRCTDGTILGLAKVGGKIIGHAKWVKHSPMGLNLATASTALAAHAVMHAVNRKLDRIEVKVERVLVALADDRRANLNGAIKTVQDSLGIKDPENVKGLLLGVAPQLRASIEAETKAFKRSIADVPEPTNQVRLGGYSLYDGTDQTRKKLVQCEDNVLAILEGVRALVQLYTALDEPKVAWTLTDQLLGDLETLELKELHRKARYIPPSTDSIWPEIFWANVMEAIAAGRQQAQGYIGNDEPVLEIEFSADESAQLFEFNSAMASEPAVMTTN